MTEQSNEAKPAIIADIDIRPVVDVLLKVFGSTESDAQERRDIVTTFVRRVGTALVATYNTNDSGLFSHIFALVFNAMWRSEDALNLRLEDSEEIMIEVFKEQRSEIPTKLKHPHSYRWRMTSRYEGKKFLLNLLLAMLIGALNVIFMPRGLVAFVIILVSGFICGFLNAWLVDKLAIWETNRLFDRHMAYLEERTREIVAYKRENGQLRDAFEQFALDDVCSKYLN